jgi:signal transduction histidine kinase
MINDNFLTKSFTVGISSNEMKRMFQGDVQFDANKLQAGKGSGLGLSIARGFNHYYFSYLIIIQSN